MKHLHIIYKYKFVACLCTAVMMLWLCSCRQMDGRIVAEIDSLNALSYGMRFTSANESMRHADEVIAKYSDGDYRDGVHLAWLNKAYAHYMLMQYDSAKYCCDIVFEESRNDVNLALADISMMLTCNMLCMSKEFYVYRNDAQGRLKRLAEESDDMSERQRRRYASVLAQFHIASVYYFTRMRLTDEINESAEWLDNNTDDFADDPTLVANHMLLRSMLRLKKTGDDTDILTQQRRNLVSLLQIGIENGYTYITGEALHRLSRSIIRNGGLRRTVSAYLMDYLASAMPDGIFPTLGDMSLSFDMALGEAVDMKALELFEQYGNRYYISRALITLSDYKLARGLFEEALTPLEQALMLVNDYHSKQTAKTPLKPYPIGDETGGMSEALSTEMLWIADPNIMSVPVWLSGIREQFSVVYGAMGMKAESDYNHNIYFDILDAMRQDQRVMQEKENLGREEQLLNLLIVCFVGALVLMALALYMFNKRSMARYHERVKRLEEVIEVCKKMADVLVEEPEDEEDLEQSLDEVLHSFTDFKDTNSFDREMHNVLRVCHEWVKEKGMLYIEFANEQRKIEGETYTLGKKYEEGKKQYLEKLTSMSIVNGITPFLDRAMREVEKMKEGSAVDQRLQYVGELIDKINEYNDVLGHWVKIRQGEVTLSIENFELQPLLDTMKLSQKAFASKNITLDIHDSVDVVKADKSLTLFMMNTLLDNARKYTPEGGKVSLTATALDNCVEIAVQDSGHGMSAEDVATINDSKVYDSRRIGTTGDHANEVREQKGFGFGLMNCRGIIEKYRKTNTLFSVCQFGVESELDKGSRFFFRLPKGVMKTMCLLMLTLAFAGASAANVNASYDIDSLEPVNDDFLAQAEYYADCQFSANVEGNYELALEYADSAISMFNAYYLKHNPESDKLMQLSGGNTAELDWWREGFSTNYTMIIGIRNEVAITALALNRNKLYHYNSEAFRQLYTLANTDHTFEQYCKDTLQANKNRKAIAVALGLIIVVVLLLYFFIHYRRYQLFIFNMRMFIALNKQIFSTSTEDLPKVLLQGISDIKQADKVEVNPDGTMDVQFRDKHLSDDEALIIDLVRQFVAIHVHFSQQKVSEHGEMIELKEDERRRMEMEQQRVHVQNMIMDNCMSALKHETMYYPNRIKQLVDAPEPPIADISELIVYYKQVFSILSSCASKQVEKMLFRRTTVTAGSIGEMARKAHKRALAKERALGEMIENAEGKNLKVMVDKTFIQVLITNIISLYQEHRSGGDLLIDYEEMDDFVRFTFTDTAYKVDENEVPNLFYVDNVKYDPERDTLIGMQYLIAKQIIREHDKYSSNRGCRIYVEATPDHCGSRFVFTLQKV